jgi:hypothetical protein
VEGGQQHPDEAEQPKRQKGVVDPQAAMGIGEHDEHMF